jgi:hypothetical protein
MYKLDIQSNILQVFIFLLYPNSIVGERYLLGNWGQYVILKRPAQAKYDWNIQILNISIFQNTHRY